MVNVYLHQASFAYSTLSNPELRDLREGAGDAFASIGSSQIVPAQVDGQGGIGTLLAEVVTGNYFQMLGVNAALGRTLLPEDDVDRGGHAVVMLGFGYWQSAFGGSRKAVGRQMRNGGHSYTIVGVAPQDFQGSLRGLTPAFYAPAAMVEELVGAPMLDERRNHSLFIKARLRDDVALPQAEAAVGRVAAALTRDAIQGWDPTARFDLVPLAEVLLYPPLDQYIRGSAWLLDGGRRPGVAAGLHQPGEFPARPRARSSSRRRHPTRAGRITRRAHSRAARRDNRAQPDLPALWDWRCPSGCSVCWCARICRFRSRFPSTSHRTGRSLFTLTVSAVAGALLGIVPAWQSTRPDLVTALKSDTRSGGRPAHVRWRNALVITQVMVSLVLLVGAGLFLRSFQRVLAARPGFGRDPAALLSFIVPATRFTDQARVYTQGLLDRFRQVPGVDALGVTDNVPLNTLSTQSIRFYRRRPSAPPGPARVRGGSSRGGRRFFRCHRHSDRAGPRIHTVRSRREPACRDRQRRDGSTLLAGRRRDRPVDSHSSKPTKTTWSWSVLRPRNHDAR